MFTLSEIEGEAGWALKRAGAENDEPPPILEVAQRLTGTRVQAVPFRVLTGDAQLARVHGEPRIYVRSGLEPKRLRWAVAHELGHLVLGVGSATRQDEEFADAFAAALLAPRRAYQLALRETGRLSYTKLARWFVTTESCAALRFGEVTDTPLALVAPERVRVRGAEFEWPVGWSGPGIKRAKLKDEKMRVVLSSV